jgi:ATP-dependent exoDNAse (exonuclease V) beta subunit
MSPLPSLVLVPAGAGSGKTYRIKEQLADWVESGAVRPDRIAAVTFTETAASELRDRLRTTLMARERMENGLNRSSRPVHALRFIERTYGPTENAAVLTALLRRSIQHLLQEYPNCMRDFVQSESAKTAVELSNKPDWRLDLSKSCTLRPLTW